MNRMEKDFRRNCTRGSCILLETRGQTKGAGAHFMQDRRQTIIDRRSGRDRRKAHDVEYLLAGGVERRSWKERRGRRERRENWIRVGKWVSVFGNLLKARDSSG